MSRQDPFSSTHVKPFVKRVKRYDTIKLGDIIFYKNAVVPCVVNRNNSFLGSHVGDNNLAAQHIMEVWRCTVTQKTVYTRKLGAREVISNEDRVMWVVNAAGCTYEFTKNAIIGQTVQSAKDSFPGLISYVLRLCDNSGGEL